MGVKRFKPTTSSLRHTIISDFAEITKSKPEVGLWCDGTNLREEGGDVVREFGAVECIYCGVEAQSHLLTSVLRLQ